MEVEYRTVLVDAAVAFWRTLPAQARISIWTTGAAPSSS